MGQKRPVQVFLLVTEDTLEESLLGTLSAKQALFLAALDPEAEASVIDLSSGIEELKNRLEILLGAKPDAPPDESLKEQVEKRRNSLLAEKKIARAGGQLLGAGLYFPWRDVPEEEETEEEPFNWPMPLKRGFQNAWRR